MARPSGERRGARYASRKRSPSPDGWVGRAQQFLEGQPCTLVGRRISPPEGGPPPSPELLLALKSGRETDSGQLPHKACRPADPSSGRSS